MEYADSLWAHLGGDTDVSSQSEVDQWLEEALDEAEDDNLDTEGVDNEPISETTWNAAARHITRREAIMSRTATGEPEWIEAARRIVANKQYETVDGMLFDGFSASAVLQLWEALGDEARAKMASLGLAKSVSIAFKIMNKDRAASTKTATAIGDVATCEDCGNQITFRADPTGQRGKAWTEDPGIDNLLDDRGFQCGLSEDNLHHPRGYTASRKQANGGLTCPTCGEPVEPTPSGNFSHVNSLTGPCGIRIMDTAQRPDGTFTDEDDLATQGLADPDMYDFSGYEASRSAMVTPMSRKHAQNDDPTRTFTLNPDDEYWIGNWTDSALNAAFDFWASEEGGAAQPYLPGYSEEMMRLIDAERTRRSGSRKTAVEVGDAVRFEGGTWYVSNEDDTGKIAITPASENGMPIDSQMGTGRWVQPSEVEVVVPRSEHPMFASRQRIALSQDEYDKWFQAGMNGDPKPSDPDQLSAWEDGKDNQAEIKRTYSSRTARWQVKRDGGIYFQADTEEEARAWMQEQRDNRRYNMDSPSWSVEEKSGSLHAAATEGDMSTCRICGRAMQLFDHAWYAIRLSRPQRAAPDHYHVAASPGRERPGEFNVDGTLNPGSPGGQGGQYDAPAGTIFDNGGNPIMVASRRTAVDEAVEHDDIETVEGTGEDDEEELYDDWAHDENGYDPSVDDPDRWRWQSGQTGVSSFATKVAAEGPPHNPDVPLWECPCLECTKLDWEASTGYVGEDDRSLSQFRKDNYPEHYSARSALTAIDDAELIDWDRRKREEQEGLVDWGGVQPQSYEKELKTHIYSDSQRRSR